jgi:Zn-dependent membrane protease YugP
MFFDPMYFMFMIPPLIFMLYAQYKVNSTYSKYSKVANSKRITGVETAKLLLRANGLDSIGLESAKTKLGDHYDPGKKVLRLSPEVGSNASVAALGIVAHEVGHALQDKTGYVFMKFRASLVPVANIGSTLGYICIIVGMLLATQVGKFGTNVMWFGVLLFSMTVLFSLVTLPVEFNASNRARQMLQANALVSTEEFNAASAVLSAAALTYVASTLQALAQLFYWVFMLMGMRGRD